MNVLEYMKDHLLILDGAMGTMLQARGLQAGELPERWNLSRPEEITAIHRAYFDAGSNVVCANTFGANRLKFGPDELEALIRAAVENAEKAREQSTGGQESLSPSTSAPAGSCCALTGILILRTRSRSMPRRCGSARRAVRTWS